MLLRTASPYCVAKQPKHKQVAMNFFSTNLLLHTLRGIIEEIESVDPNASGAGAA